MRLTPLGYVIIFAFALGALTAQVHFWQSVRDRVEPEA